jgi:SAM-dependent methyltransferase
VDLSPDTNYRRDLAMVHHRGFAGHPDNCAPGVIEFLAPVRARNGLVLELGCGTGLLTRHLIAAGHRVIATDAAPAMLDLARELVGDSAQDVRQLVLPDDPLPEADAIVAVGHPLNYLPDAEAVDRALAAMAGALRPGGRLAFDLCDLEWGRARRETPGFAGVGPDWAIITRFSVPAPDRFVRDITTFLPTADGSWRRDDEHHDTVLIDTAQVQAWLHEHGVQAQVGSSFGPEINPPGLVVITGHKPAVPGGGTGSSGPVGVGGSGRPDGRGRGTRRGGGPGARRGNRVPGRPDRTPAQPPMEWMPLASIPALIKSGEIWNAASLLPLLRLLVPES